MGFLAVLVCVCVVGGGGLFLPAVVCGLAAFCALQPAHVLSSSMLTVVFSPVRFRASTKFACASESLAPSFLVSQVPHAIHFGHAKHVFLHCLQHGFVSARVLLPQVVLHLCAGYFASPSLCFENNTPAWHGLVVCK